MKTVNGFFITVAIAAMLAGCASKPLTDAAGVPKSVIAEDECRFPGTSEKAPGWICGAPVEGLALSAAGNAEFTAAGYGFARDMAEADGRDQLARKISVQVSSMVKRYAQTVGTGKGTKVDKVDTLVSKQVTSETLNGSRVVRIMTGPDKRLWVLVGLEGGALDGIERSAVSSLARELSDDAQRARGQQAQEELVESILRAGR